MKKLRVTLTTGLFVLSSCAAYKPEVFTVVLPSSNKSLDVVSQRIDNKDCPNGATQAIFDDKGAIIGHVAFGGNSWYCHGIDQLGGVAQGVGVGVGLSNLKPAHGDSTTNNNVNQNDLNQQQGQSQSQWQHQLMHGYGVAPFRGTVCPTPEACAAGYPG